jgi:superfamily I DNA and/or RNA helicase
VRVGTVDKFQGQQATVVFFSMASSSSEDVPRGLDFLYSRNRLNVAVSRARCLAYVVASPRLLEAGCKTVEQMRLVNALCRFVEVAEEGP